MVTGPRPSRFDEKRDAGRAILPQQSAPAPEDERLGRNTGLHAAGSSDLVEQLGVLDDLVFEAIAGRTDALDKLRALWPEVKSAVGPALVEESREQYVRHAIGIWRDCIAGGDLRDPATAIAAMDVVSLLFDE
jgi:hypothetical protein